MAVVVADAHKQPNVLILQEVGIVGSLCVHKHLKALVHTHVDAGVFEHGTAVSVAKSAGAHAQGLLVLLKKRGVAEQYLAANSRRHAVGYWNATAVLFKVYRIDGKGGCHGLVNGNHFSRGIEVEPVATPFASDQVESGHANNYRLLPIVQNPAGKADGAKVLRPIDALVWLKNGNFELNPANRSARLVGQKVRSGFVDVGNVVSAYHQVLRAHGNFVAEVLLRAVKGCVAVDVFFVGHVGAHGGLPIN